MANDEKADDRAFIEDFNAKVDAGEPVIQWVASEIIRVVVSPTGEALVDFVMGKFPDNRATVARLVLTRETAQILKVELAKNENIPDGPGLARNQRPMN